MTMEISDTAAALLERHDAQRLALAEQHLRELRITSRQALAELWAAEDRARDVARRYQTRALAKIRAEGS
jgi:hypothetical protein